MFMLHRAALHKQEVMVARKVMPKKLNSKLNISLCRPKLGVRNSKCAQTVMLYYLLTPLSVGCTNSINEP